MILASIHNPWNALKAFLPVDGLIIIFSYIRYSVDKDHSGLVGVSENYGQTHCEYNLCRNNEKRITNKNYLQKIK